MNVNGYPVLKWSWSPSTNTQMLKHLKLSLTHLKIVLKQTCNQVSVRLADISAQHLWGRHLSEQIPLDALHKAFASFTPKLSPRGSLLQCLHTVINALTPQVAPRTGERHWPYSAGGHDFKSWNLSKISMMSQRKCISRVRVTTFSLITTTDGVKTSSKLYRKPAWNQLQDTQVLL